MHGGGMSRQGAFKKNFTGLLLANRKKKCRKGIKSGPEMHAFSLQISQKSNQRKGYQRKRKLGSSSSCKKFVMHMYGNRCCIRKFKILEFLFFVKLNVLYFNFLLI